MCVLKPKKLEEKIWYGFAGFDNDVSLSYSLTFQTIKMNQVTYEHCFILKTYEPCFI